MDPVFTIVALIVIIGTHWGQPHFSKYHYVNIGKRSPEQNSGDMSLLVETNSNLNHLVSLAKVLT